MIIKLNIILTLPVIASPRVHVDPRWIHGGSTWVHVDPTRTHYGSMVDPLWINGGSTWTRGLAIIGRVKANPNPKMKRVSDETALAGVHFS